VAKKAIKLFDGFCDKNMVSFLVVVFKSSNAVLQKNGYSD